MCCRVLSHPGWTSLSSRACRGGAWNHALPGHEAAERDALLREIGRNLRAEKPAIREPIRLRVVRC
jgi:hypothetical protein